MRLLELQYSQLTNEQELTRKILQDFMSDMMKIYDANSDGQVNITLTKDISLGVQSYDEKINQQ